MGRGRPAPSERITIGIVGLGSRGFNLLDEFWDAETTTLNLDPEDEIVQGCVITRDGGIVNETIKNL